MSGGAIAGPGADRPLASGAWRAGLAVAFALGATLRLAGFADQVLVDDEWHALHRAVADAPAAILVTLGHADYGIPIALYYQALAATVGVSEAAMRAPMMAAGLATIVLVPLAIAGRIGRLAALGTAFLLALAPLAVAYSQVARPYAITLLAGAFAHWAFARWWQGDGRRWGAAYVAATALAGWMHLVAIPFLLAPLAWGVAQLALDARARAARARALAWLAASAGGGLALLVGPALVVQSAAIGVKSGFVAPDAGTLAGAAHLWLGTRSAPLVLAALVVAACGVPRAWRALPEFRTMFLGLALTASAHLAMRPEWGHVPIVLARYLLPVLLLLAIALPCGAAAIGARAGGDRTALAATAIATTLVVALALTGPLREWMRTPNSYRIAFGAMFDFRKGPNPATDAIAAIPLSTFWSTLRGRPRGSVLVAAAPFRFETYDWDAPRWERESGQRVVPGWIGGLCVSGRPGEPPAAAGVALRNGVRLADGAEVAARGVDYVVWQRPWPGEHGQRLLRNGERFDGCEAALVARFGAPVHDDGLVAVFRAAPA